MEVDAAAVVASQELRYSRDKYRRHGAIYSYMHCFGAECAIMCENKSMPPSRASNRLEFTFEIFKT